MTSQTDRITSRDNPKIKFACRIREGREPGLIFVEGSRLVEEALRSPVEIKEAFVSDEFLIDQRGKALVEALHRRGMSIYSTPQSVADSLSDTKNGQGIVVIAARPHSFVNLNLSISTDGNIPIILFLEKINNPSNLGAVLRTAEAAGVMSVLLSKESADPFSPKALRASMGSAFRIPITIGTDLETVIDLAKVSDFIPTAADINALNDHNETDWKKPRILIFGSEAHGLALEVREKICELTKIDIADDVESLNLAVSCGIILFEAKRQNDAAR